MQIMITNQLWVTHILQQNIPKHTKQIGQYRSQQTTADHCQRNKNTLFQE